MRQVFLLPVLLLLCGTDSMTGSRPDSLPPSAERFVFPTKNPWLGRGQPERFYAPVERDFEGKKTFPWEGGMYGFTRTPKRENGRIFFTRFHEGIDISPLQRDENGEPLDPVFASADGTVVHVSADPGASNYGIYVVLQHECSGSPFFTLYSHLADVRVKPGQRVSQGETLGLLGYTGRGINKARAHVHFEICMMWNRNFEFWFPKFFQGTENKHGIFNGMNLQGMDPVGVMEYFRSSPSGSLAGFVQTLPPAFRITIPNAPGFDLVRLYPWLVRSSASGAQENWNVFFSDSFVPVKVSAASSGEAAYSVEWLSKTSVPLIHASRGWISGTPDSPVLSESGRRFVELLLQPDSLNSP